MNSPSNYELMKQKARKIFAGLSAQEIEERTDIECRDGYFRLSLLGKEYRIKAEDGLALSEDGTEAGYNEALILYDILGYTEKGARPTGEYAVIQRLSAVHNAHSYAGEGMYSRYEKEWDGKTETLSEALRTLGGEPFGKGDVSFRVPLFSGLSAVFSYWNSDDEFPASMNLLFDTGILSFMHYETVWYLASLILSAVRKLVSPRL